MPRWFPLCKGTDIPACADCRRFVNNNPRDAADPKQGFRQPELIGTHCNGFMERPVYETVAITPTDHR